MRMKALLFFLNPPHYCKIIFNNYSFYFCFIRVIATFPDPPSQNRVTVLQMDLDTLEDGQELNDAIIDFFVL